MCCDLMNEITSRVTNDKGGSGPCCQRLWPPVTPREKPSSSVGFRYISSAGARATDTTLQLIGSSSAGATRATTTSVSSSVGKDVVVARVKPRATTNPCFEKRNEFVFRFFCPNLQISELF